MSIASEQEQLDYFYKRVETIKQSKLSEKYALIPEPYFAIVTHEEVVQALIDGSATLHDKDKDNTGAIHISDLNWPKRSIAKQEHFERVAQAQENYNTYDRSLSASISKIMDKVVLGKLKPLEAIEQIEQLA